MAAELNGLFVAHLKTLRNTAALGGVNLDATTLVIKDIPTVRAGVAVPVNDINTEMRVYITANG
jgi:hypothetical protein